MRDADDRCDAWDAAAGPDDHLAVDPLAKIRFGEPTLATSGADRRCLQTEPGLAHRRGGVVDYPVVRRPPVLQRQVEPYELEVEAQT